MQINADWIKFGAAPTVCAMLNNAGFQAFYVGGCVRNELLKRATTDIDMATDATPKTVMALAKNTGLTCIPTGLQHGTVTLISDNTPVEVTTFRCDVETDGRHADVQFSQSIVEDAKRRDFTMNALYADINGDISDPLGGLDDLLARRVKFIEDPNDRITEDYLRILRFFRFHAIYGDQTAGMDTAALDAIARNLDGIKTLSKERIGQEMRKLLGAKDPSPSLATMAQSGVLPAILEGANVTSIAPLIHLESTIQADPDWMRRLVCLGASNVKSALRLSKKETQTHAAILNCVTNAMTPKIAGYRLGAEHGLSAALVLSAHLGQPLPADLQQHISLGSTAQFPVSAKDLLDQVQGAELGLRLKFLETQWLQSGLTLSKVELLNLTSE